MPHIIFNLMSSVILMTNILLDGPGVRAVSGLVLGLLVNDVVSLNPARGTDVRHTLCFWYKSKIIKTKIHVL